jgi:hypothetical protein
MATPIFIAATLALFAGSDPKADDAARVFSDLCVSRVAGQVPTLAKPDFEATEFDPASAKRIKPELGNETLWDVHGAKSDVSMLVHYGAAGPCTVEIAEANEEAVRKAFTSVAADIAHRLDAPAMAEPVQTKRVEGKNATITSWRYETVSGNVRMWLTTYPDAKFMVQHVAIISKVP